MEWNSDRMTTVLPAVAVVEKKEKKEKKKGEQGARASSAGGNCPVTHGDTKRRRRSRNMQAARCPHSFVCIPYLGY